MKTYHDFPEFYEHEFIKSIADKEKWTISDKDKRPIDMYALKYQNRIIGSTFLDSSSLVSLQDLCETVPNAHNHAFRMDCYTDGFIILDVEPACPPELKEKFLNTNYIYGEKSLSGNGLHLVYPTPEYLNEYPAAMQKVKMQDANRYYEFLLDHWVTFTRDMLPPATGTDTIEDVFRELAALQKTTADKTEFESDSKMSTDSIPDFDELVMILANQTYNKKAEDFLDDLSKYEFGCAGFYHYKLKQLLKLSKFKNNGHEYDPNELTWIIYTVIKDVLPYREKHDGKRGGAPWLFYMASEVVAKNL